MGRMSDSGKEGRWVEGRASEEHVHNDGTRGRDIEAFTNTYSKGKMVHSEKSDGWGKVHDHSDSGDSSK